MQAKNLKKQAAAKARSAALTPAQRSKIAAKAALKKAGYPSAEYVGTLSLGKLFKNPVAKLNGTKMFRSVFLNDARRCCFLPT